MIEKSPAGLPVWKNKTNGRGNPLKTQHQGVIAISVAQSTLNHRPQKKPSAIKDRRLPSHSALLLQVNHALVIIRRRNTAHQLHGWSWSSARLSILQTGAKLKVLDSRYF